MTSLESLLEKMVRGHIIGAIIVPNTQNEVTQVLGLRDKDEFSRKWMEVFEMVEAHKKRQALEPSAVDLVTKLREEAFIQTFERWHSSDLAAYVSDDFGLIGDTLLHEIDHPLVNGLLESYIHGNIPTILSAAP